MTADLGELMVIALGAADAARRIMHASGPAVITEKADRDLVSDIDVAIEREVRGYLRQATPDIEFLGEEEGGDGDRRLAIRAAGRLRDAIVAIGDYATGHDPDRRNQAQLAVTSRLIPRVQRIRMLGTAAIDLAWLAEGRLDASVTLTNPPWDMAAGVIIAREAGAMVVDTDGSSRPLRSSATIAGAPHLIPQILPLVRGQAV